MLYEELEETFYQGDVALSISMLAFYAIIKEKIKSMLFK